MKKSRQGDRKRAVAALAPRARPIEAKNRFESFQNTDDDDDDDDDARKIGANVVAPLRGTPTSSAPLRPSGSTTWKRKPLGSLGKVCPRDGGSSPGSEPRGEGVVSRTALSPDIHETHLTTSPLGVATAPGMENPGVETVDAKTSLTAS